MTGIERPWKVFVRDIGPTFSFAIEANAHERARSLIPEYAEVIVYRLDVWPDRRTVYRYDSEPRTEVFDNDRGTWKEES